MALQDALDALRYGSRIQQQQQQPEPDKQPAVKLPRQVKPVESEPVSNPVFSSLAGAANVLDLPGSMIRDVVTWLPGGTPASNPFDQLLSPFSGENRVSGRKLLQDHELAEKYDTWGNFGAGLAAEIVTDPLSWMTLGIGGAGKNVATKAGQNVAKAGLNNMVKRSAQVMGKGEADRLLPSVGQTVSGAAGKLKNRFFKKADEAVEQAPVEAAKPVSNKRPVTEREARARVTPRDIVLSMEEIARDEFLNRIRREAAQAGKALDDNAIEAANQYGRMVAKGTLDKINIKNADDLDVTVGGNWMWNLPFSNKGTQAGIPWLANKASGRELFIDGVRNAKRIKPDADKLARFDSIAKYDGPVNQEMLEGFLKNTIDNVRSRSIPMPGKLAPVVVENILRSGQHLDETGKLRPEFGQFVMDNADEIKNLFERDEALRGASRVELPEQAPVQEAPVAQAVQQAPVQPVVEPVQQAPVQPVAQQPRSSTEEMKQALDDSNKSFYETYGTAAKVDDVPHQAVVEPVQQAPVAPVADIPSQATDDIEIVESTPVGKSQERMRIVNLTADVLNKRLGKASNLSNEDVETMKGIVKRANDRQVEIRDWKGMPDGTPEKRTVLELIEPLRENGKLTLQTKREGNELQITELFPTVLKFEELKDGKVVREGTMPITALKNYLKPLEVEDVAKPQVVSPTAEQMEAITKWAGDGSNGKNAAVEKALSTWDRYDPAKGSVEQFLGSIQRFEPEFKGEELLGGRGRGVQSLDVETPTGSTRAETISDVSVPVDDATKLNEYVASFPNGAAIANAYETIPAELTQRGERKIPSIEKVVDYLATQGVDVTQAQVKKFRKGMEELLPKRAQDAAQEPIKTPVVGTVGAKGEASVKPTSTWLGSMEKAVIDRFGDTPETRQYVSDVQAVSKAMADAAGMDVDDFFKAEVRAKDVFDKGEDTLFQSVAKAGADEATSTQAAREWQEKGVRSPFFKRWFGDFEADPAKASKVVDANGEPLVVYHGTDADFDSFANPYADDVSGDWSMFSESPDYSNNFARGRSGVLKPVMLDIKNPVDLSDLPPRRGDVRNKILSRLEQLGFDTESLNKLLPYERDLFQFINRKGFRGEFVKQARKLGFDGVKMPDSFNDGSGDILATTWVTFNPTQVKSAIGNTGEFSPTNPSILAQGNRGAVVFDTLAGDIDSLARVFLLKDADKSTLVHEMAHIARRRITAMPEKYGADFATKLNQAYGITNNEWDVAAEEAFALDFEKYLATGEAPTKELNGVFARIKDWIASVYKSIKDSPLGRSLTPEKTEIFDTILGKKPRRSAQPKQNASFMVGDDVNNVLSVFGIKSHKYLPTGQISILKGVDPNTPDGFFRSKGSLYYKSEDQFAGPLYNSIDFDHIDKVVKELNNKGVSLEGISWVPDYNRMRQGLSLKIGEDVYRFSISDRIDPAKPDAIVKVTKTGPNGVERDFKRFASPNAYSDAVDLYRSMAPDVLYQQPITGKAAKQETLFQSVLDAGSTASTRAQAAKEWRELGTRSSFFKRWFGDFENDPANASKVVDANGNPLVVYHGTRSAADFSKFSKTQDFGFHFTPEPKSAERAVATRLNAGRQSGSPRVFPVYLDIKNPIRLKETYDIDSAGGWRATEVARQLSDNGVLRWEPTRNDFVEVDGRYVPASPKPGLIDKSWIEYIADIHGRAVSKAGGNDEFFKLSEVARNKLELDEIKKDLQSVGYDGVVYRNAVEGGGDSYIAFRPEQIKSAIGNTGEFSRSNPSILYQSATAPQGPGYADRVLAAYSELEEAVGESPVGRLIKYAFHSPAMGFTTSATQRTAAQAYNARKQGEISARAQAAPFAQVWARTKGLDERAIVADLLSDKSTKMSKREAVLEAREQVRINTNSMLDYLEGRTEVIPELGHKGEDLAKWEAGMRTLRNMFGSFEDTALEYARRNNTWIETGKEVLGGDISGGRGMVGDEYDAGVLIHPLMDKDIKRYFPRFANTLPAKSFGQFVRSFFDEQSMKWARDANPGMLDPNRGPLLDVNIPSSKQRKDSITNIPGGSTMVNNLSVDPNVSGIAHTLRIKDDVLPPEELDRLMKYVKANYPGWVVEKNPALQAELDAQLAKTVNYMANLPRQFALDRVPLLSPDLFSNALFRLQQSEQAKAMAGIIFGVMATSSKRRNLIESFDITKIDLEDFDGFDKDLSHIPIEKFLREKDYQSIAARQKIVSMLPTEDVEIVRDELMSRLRDKIDKIEKEFAEQSGVVDEALKKNKVVRNKAIGKTVEYIDNFGHRMKLSKRADGNWDFTKTGSDKRAKQFDLPEPTNELEGGRLVPRFEEVLDADGNVAQQLRKKEPISTEEALNRLTVSDAEVLHNFIVPRKEFEELIRVTRPPQWSEAFRTFVTYLDAYTNLWKSLHTGVFPFVAFHARNRLSGGFANLTSESGSGDPRFGWYDPRRIMQPSTDSRTLYRYGQALRDLQGIDPEKRAKAQQWIEKAADRLDLASIPALRNEIVNPDGTMKPAQEQLDALQRLGFVHEIVGGRQGVAAEQLGHNKDALASQLPGEMPALTKPPADATVMDRWFDPTRQKGIRGEETAWMPAVWGSDMSRYVEHQNRFAPFMALLRQGYDAATAADIVKRAQVDYTDTTPFQRDVLRRMFPFASFSVGAAKHYGQEFLDRPGGMTGQTIRAINAARDKDALAPEHILETAAIPMGEGEDGTRNYLTGFGLGFEDPIAIAAPAASGQLGETGRELISRMNPLVKAIIEGSTGVSTFQRGPFGARYLDDMDPTLGRTVSNVSDLVTGERTEQAQPLFGSDNLEFAVENSPISRYTGLARTLTDPRKWDNPLALMLNTGTGMRINQVSPGAQDAIERGRIAREIKDMGGRNFETPYFPDWREESFTDEEQARAEELLARLKELERRAKERRLAREAAAQP